MPINRHLHYDENRQREGYTSSSSAQMLRKFVDFISFKRFKIQQMYNTTQNDAMFYDRKVTITIVYKSHQIASISELHRSLMVKQYLDNFKMQYGLDLWSVHFIEKTARKDLITSTMF